MVSVDLLNKRYHGDVAAAIMVVLPEAATGRSVHVWVEWTLSLDAAHMNVVAAGPLRDRGLPFPTR